MRRLQVALPQINYVETRNADYVYRTVVTTEEWIGFLSGQVEALDYTNFKDRVAKTLGRGRHDLLMKVWSIMRALQAPSAERPHA